jgi:replication-associated recombination protein RarA
MENFIVSARKYRPQEFDTVVGQSHITDTLEHAIEESQLAQALLSVVLEEWENYLCQNSGKKDQ